MVVSHPSAGLFPPEPPQNTPGSGVDLRALRRRSPRQSRSGGLRCPHPGRARPRLAELSEFLGFRTNNFAEYSGLLGCLQWALDHGHPRLRVVSDSELMVKQIQGKYKVNSPDLRPLWEESKRRIALLQGFQITHALRHKNKDADRLANEAMDRGMKRPPADHASRPQQATTYPAKASAPPSPESPANRSGTMLRGFTREGTVHLLGGATLPDGVFVKVVVE